MPRLLCPVWASAFTATCIWAAAVPLLAVEEVAIPWLSTNLVVNAGFEMEETKGEAPEGGQPKTVIPGWTYQVTGTGTVRTDATGSLEGQKALKIDLPSSASGIAVSSEPIPVEPNKGYLFSIAYRQAGFNRLPGHQNKYEGVNSYSVVQWLDQDRKPTGLGQTACAFPYAPSAWDLKDVFAYSPPQARFAVISIHIGNNSEKEIGKVIPSTLWVDAIQFREHRPPPTPDWAKQETPRIVEGGQEKTPGKVYFVASSPDFANARGGQWSKVIIDPKAERGSALEAPAGVGTGMMAHSPYYPAMAAGLYRLRARLKVADNQSAERTGCIDVDSGSSGQRLLIEIFPKNFAAANEYVDLEKDFILRDTGWWDIRFQTYGKTAWAVDSVKVIPIFTFEDRQLLAVFPGMAGEIAAALRPRRTDPCRVLMVAGLGYDMFKTVPALRMLAQNVEIKTAWVKSGMFLTLGDFPETAEEVFDFNVIVMGNVPASTLSLRQKCYLREYLHRGGALLVLGGVMSYGRGSWQGSLLEETLPVEVKRSLKEDTLFQPKGVRLAISDAAPDWAKGVDLDPAPYAYFLHQATLKPQAQVFVCAEKHPFLAGGEYGEGRSVCVLAMPYGKSSSGQTAFWNWTDWGYLLRDAMWWAMRRNMD